jgi:hypothetical protein
MTGERVLQTLAPRSDANSLVMDDGNDLIRNLLAERLRPDPALKMMDRCELR